MKFAKEHLTDECMELALELSSAPRLFSKFGEPAPILWKKLTGQRLEMDEQRCLMASALRMLHRSDREIAATLRCDVRSIPLMLAAAEKSGRIPALKERLTVLAGANAESANIALGAFLNEASTGKGNLEDAAMIKSLATAAGISTEKYLLLTGSATEIVEHRIATGREEMEEWAKANAIPIEVTTPVDSESNSNTNNINVIEGVSTHGNVKDTSPPSNTQTPQGSPDTPGDRGGDASGPTPPDRPMGQDC